MNVGCLGCDCVEFQNWAQPQAVTNGHPNRLQANTRGFDPLLRACPSSLLPSYSSYNLTFHTYLQPLCCANNLNPVLMCQNTTWAVAT